MAFMIPQYTSEDFFCGPSEPDIGVTIYSPVEAHGTVERFASDCGADAEFVDRITGKWWWSSVGARLHGRDRVERPVRHRGRSA